MDGLDKRFTKQTLVQNCFVASLLYLVLSIDGFVKNQKSPVFVIP